MLALGKRKNSMRAGSALPKMAHVRIQSLTPGNSQENTSQDNGRLEAVSEEIPQTNQRIESRQNSRVSQYLG